MFSIWVRLRHTIAASLFSLSALAALANLGFPFGYKGFAGNKKRFPVLHLLDGMNESLRERSQYLANITSALKVSSLEYISQSQIWTQARNMRVDTNYLCPLAEGLEKCYNSVAWGE